MEEKLKIAIKKTKEYGKKFGVEYNKNEIAERLISSKIYNLKFKIYKARNVSYLKKIELAKELVNKVNLKNILFIGVTGSVAAGRPPEESDIDLMIITKRDSLWISRLLLRLLVKVEGIPHRKYGMKEGQDEFCFNLWMEEDNLTLPKNRQNLRNAMDLILMKPVLNKDFVYERFILKNDWANKYVATGYYNKSSNFKLETSIKNKEQSLIRVFINWLVFWPQWWYMKKKLGAGLVNKKMAFFHPNDR